MHRRLVGAQDKSEFVETLVQLHSAIFGLSPEAVRESVQWRERAADIVNLITGKLSTNIEEDRARLEEYLRLARFSKLWPHETENTRL